MIAGLRAAVVLLACCVAVDWVRASTGNEAPEDLQDDAQESVLSDADASSRTIRDDSVLLASAEEPAASDAETSLAPDSDFCCEARPTWPCMCCCPPLWYGSVGTVILHRDRPTAGTIVGAQPVGSPAFSRGSDFNFGWNAGPDATVGRRMANGDFLEGRYFNSYGSATTQFVTPSNFIGAGFVGPGGTAISGRDLTKLDSFELNWRRQTWNQLALLAGFRWIELKDDALYHVGPSATGDYNFNNHLYGGQLGADWALTGRSSPLQLKLVGKAGVFGNVNDGGITQSLGGSPVGGFSGRGSTAAFVGEVDFSAAYLLTSHIAIRGGYQLLWLTDLALAADAASRSLVNPPLLTTVGDNGHLFYQGATVGIDFMW